MINRYYRKTFTVLFFILALSFAFYFAFGNIRQADATYDNNVYQCNNGMCIGTSGSGTSVCILDSDCVNNTPRHLECRNNACTVVNGSGITNCIDDSTSCGGGATPTPNTEPGNGDLPGIDLTVDRITQIIYAFACWLWSVSMFLLVIFIIIAGLRFMYAGGDPTKFASAKTNFKYVILGTIVVMGTFVIISTVAYNIGVDISFVPFDCSGTPPEPTTRYSCDSGGACIVDPNGGYTNSDCDNACAPTPTPTPTPTPVPSSVCLTGQQLAQQYNELYPRANAPELDTLIACIRNKLPGRDLGSVFTYEVSNEFCNYTRGTKATNASCQPQSCSYVVNSCHYGGRTGSTGARSVNYGNESIGNLIIQAANQCGAKPGSRCETSSNRTVACPTSGNNPNIHVHVNTATCDSN